MHTKSVKRAAGGIAVLALIMSMPLQASAADVSYGSGSTGANAVPVTMEYQSTGAKALIPKSLSFNSNSGSYTVSAYIESDAASDLKTGVSIVPDRTFLLRKEGADNVCTASVSQEKTVFTAQDVKDGMDAELSVFGGGSISVKRTDAQGVIAAESITDGTWSGVMTFTVTAGEAAVDSAADKAGRLLETAGGLNSPGADYTEWLYNVRAFTQEQGLQELEGIAEDGLRSSSNSLRMIEYRDKIAGFLRSNFA